MFGEGGRMFGEGRAAASASAQESLVGPWPGDGWPTSSPRPSLHSGSKLGGSSRLVCVRPVKGRLTDLASRVYQRTASSFEVANT